MASDIQSARRFGAASAGHRHGMAAPTEDDEQGRTEHVAATPSASRGSRRKRIAQGIVAFVAVGALGWLALAYLPLPEPPDAFVRIDGNREIRMQIDTSCWGSWRGHTCSETFGMETCHGATTVEGSTGAKLRFRLHDSPSEAPHVTAFLAGDPLTKRRALVSEPLGRSKTPRWTLSVEPPVLISISARFGDGRNADYSVCID